MLGSTNFHLNHISTQVIQADKLITHEDYFFPKADIALIKVVFIYALVHKQNAYGTQYQCISCSKFQLKTPAVINNLVRPICMPAGETTPVDKKCVAVGWGIGKNLGRKTLGLWNFCTISYLFLQLNKRNL